MKPIRRKSEVRNQKSEISAALSPEKAGVLRVIVASEEFGVAVAELCARIRAAGVQLSDAAALTAVNTLCDRGLIIMAGEPPKYFGSKFRPAI